MKKKIQTDWQENYLQNIQTAQELQQKIKQANLKMDRKPKQTFPKRRYTDVQNHMKRFSTSLITREMQIKTAMAISPHTNQNGYHQKV